MSLQLSLYGISYLPSPYLSPTLNVPFFLLAYELFFLPETVVVNNDIVVRIVRVQGAFQESS